MKKLNHRKEGNKMKDESKRKPDDKQQEGK